MNKPVSMKALIAAAGKNPMGDLPSHYLELAEKLAACLPEDKFVRYWRYRLHSPGAEKVLTWLTGGDHTN